MKKSVFFQKATQLIRRSGGCTVFDSSGGKWFLRKEPDLERVWGELKSRGKIILSIC